MASSGYYSSFRQLFFTLGVKSYVSFQTRAAGALRVVMGRNSHLAPFLRVISLGQRSVAPNMARSKLLQAFVQLVRNALCLWRYLHVETYSRHPKCWARRYGVHSMMIRAASSFGLRRASQPTLRLLVGLASPSLAACFFARRLPFCATRGTLVVERHRCDTEK